MTDPAMSGGSAEPKMSGPASASTRQWVAVRLWHPSGAAVAGQVTAGVNGGRSRMDQASEKIFRYNEREVSDF